jgi:GGDEF domain-containing protein
MCWAFSWVMRCWWRSAKRLVAIGEGVVARVQTNQLCLLLPNSERLAQVRSQLESAFAEPVTVLGQTLDVSLSIGMAHLDR